MKGQTRRELGAELTEVVALAQAGSVAPRVERFALDEAHEAYRRLREGRLRGRAVIVS